ncbi:MAG: AbrB/MazE/SpoVT family DNA-binding domain-containing protein [Oscillospiraceae bacterium]|jgi:AbrB family transcriptional regulator (stage V sporulation protein T)|nr:AbrB/MazE/SpoVT family DNA-binding domain-containing protein [Oscillospiraceae bacterium]
MKATGIVRRIDDLGRVVIPKEIRRTMRIREGDPLEIYTSSDGEVVFKKYSPIGEISAFSSMYAEVLNKTGGLPVIVCDKDHVLSAAGMPKKEILERRISPALEDLIQQRKNIAYTEAGQERLRPVEGIDRYAVASGLIIVSGDVVGCILLLSGDSESKASELQVKMINVAANLLAKQLEE